MACVRDLLDLESLREAELVAGCGGLYRTVSWPNMAQTHSIREWLLGGDVIIMTGIGLDPSYETLHNILIQAVEADSACLVAHLSEDYIPALPPDLLIEADELDFPIFTIPWATRIADIIRDISRMLMMEQYQDESRDLLLEELLLSSDSVPSESLLSFIKRQHLAEGHAVLVVEWQMGRTSKETLHRGILSRQQGNNLVMQELQGRFPQTLDLDQMRYAYFLVRLEKEQMDALYDVCVGLCQYIREQYPGIGVQIGIGQVYDDPLRFHVSATEARKALGSCCRDGHVMRFDKLGIYQLLAEIPDQLRVRQFAVSHLEPLLDHDLKTGKDFLRTLEVYLNCNCNMNQTAQQLYIHRNTLSYQIERIEALLDADLEDAETRNMLFNCLKIFRYCQK